MKTTTRNETAKQRLEYLRGVIRTARVSYDELHELQSLKAHIAPGDVELLEAAGVPEFPETAGYTPGPWEFGKKSLHVFSKPTGKHLATIHIPLQAWQDEREQAYADAQLMKAAPELLEALRLLVDASETKDDVRLTASDRDDAPLANEWDAALLRARAAIARATGE